MSPMLAAVHIHQLTMIVPAIIVGAAAVYLLLPQPTRKPWWIGALLAAIAILLAGFTIVRTGVLSAETFLFYAFSLIAVVSGGLLVTQHNPARAALSFTLVVLSTCGLFLLLAAPFLAAATIIIYAGAIIVTFLFVLMLAQQTGLGDADARSREPLLATITGFVLLGALVYVLQLSYEDNALIAQTDQLLAATRQTKAALSSDHYPQNELDALLVAIGQALEKPEFRALADRQQLAHLRDNFENRDKQPSEKELRTELNDLEQALLRTRQQTTWLMPPSNAQVISDLSGPSVNEPLANLRYDDQGRPRMPADNPAYLGRSLFTDYLLPVELGGFLLLVAVIGSIAIAHRRPATSERPA